MLLIRLARMLPRGPVCWLVANLIGTLKCDSQTVRLSFPNVFYELLTRWICEINPNDLRTTLALCYCWRKIKSDGFSGILPSPSALHSVKRKTTPWINKNVSEAYCMLDAVEETASGCVSLQGQRTWIRQLYLEVKLWARRFPTVLSGARQTAVSWTKCLKDLKKKIERKKF